MYLSGVEDSLYSTAVEQLLLTAVEGSLFDPHGRRLLLIVVEDGRIGSVEGVRIEHCRRRLG
jgi:hypothetical protein